MLFISRDPEERIYSTKYVHICLEYHRVCPLVRIWTPLPPVPQASVSLSPAGEGVGGPNLDEWRKNLALCLLLYGYNMEGSR
jgi:hypothetical protein